jgi:hypothetical protein
MDEEDIEWLKNEVATLSREVMNLQLDLRDCLNRERRQ